MDAIISKGIEDFLDYMREMIQLHRISEANEQEYSDATQDILHSIELEEHDYHESARMARKLKEVRQQRRCAKDLISKTLPIVEWAESNQAIFKSLERLLGEVRKAEKRTEGRIYTPKTNVGCKEDEKQNNPK